MFSEFMLDYHILLVEQVIYMWRAMSIASRWYWLSFWLECDRMMEIVRLISRFWWRGSNLIFLKGNWLESWALDWKGNILWRMLFMRPHWHSNVSSIRPRWIKSWKTWKEFVAAHRQHCFLDDWSQLSYLSRTRSVILYSSTLWTCLANKYSCCKFRDQMAASPWLERHPSWKRSLQSLRLGCPCRQIVLANANCSRVNCSARSLFRHRY